ncbi:unnamed protein product, partial [Polarella glacialis]
ECLLGTLAISLCTVAVALVLLDSTLSLKLSRDIYGPSPGRGGRLASGCRSCWVFAAQLAYRLVEVAAKLSVVAVTATVLQPSYFAGYVALSYLANVVVLLGSCREAHSPCLGSSMVIAWPLLFANLSQFVDCPKHYAAAQHAASLVCGLRALEIAVAVSLVAAAFLLEVEVLDPSGTATGWLADVQTASIVRTWQALCH